MSQAVERLVRQLNLSGLCGFDFIEDSIDGSIHLIDFNPRATQTCCLLSYEGAQPVLSLAAQLRGLPPPIANRFDAKHGPIALFPHWIGKHSEYADIDPPLESTELVRIGLEFQRQQNRFLMKTLRRTKTT